MSDTPAAVNEIFSAMPDKLNAGAASGLDCVIQYDLDGEGGGTYHTVIKDGSCEVHNDSHPTPTMTISMNAADFVEMTHGRLDGMAAFMSGKLRVSGDMGLAMKMQTLFS